MAVVGSRTATSYGEQVAADLAAGLATRGWTVVSGAAFGIDGSAHRGALAVDGPTVAVLAGGVERRLPGGALRSDQAHRAAWPRRVGGRAGLGSDEVTLPVPQPAHRGHDPRHRRRRGRPAVRARATPSSTPSIAGRPVGAVPGPITSMASSGCHQEIRDGRAALVTSADEVIDLVGDLGADACEPLHGPVLSGRRVVAARRRGARGGALPRRRRPRSPRRRHRAAAIGIRAALGRLERAGPRDGVRGPVAQAPRPPSAECLTVLPVAASTRLSGPAGVEWLRPDRARLRT